MAMLVVIALLLGIWFLAYLHPPAFHRFYETYAKDSVLAVSGAVMALLSYVQSDTSWQQLMNPKYLPLSLVMIGLIGIVLRAINDIPDDPRK